MKSRTQQEFAKRWVGVVEIKTGESTAKLTSVDKVGKDGKQKLFPGDLTTLKIKLSDFPKSALRVIRPNMDTKKVRVRLNEDADAVETVTPVAGVFPARLIGLGPKTKDGEYKLIEKTYNKDTEKENSHLEFIAMYTITEGPFREVELPGFYLHYKFEGVPEGDEDEGFTRFNTVDTPQASQLHKLQSWAEAHGNILDEPIRWPDDGIILDELEERAIDADRPVNLVFENGWIKSVQAQETYEEVDVDDPDAVDAILDEEVEPVKVAKTAKADGKLKKAPAKKKVAEADDDL
jgi:hypothetical protein